MKKMKRILFTILVATFAFVTFNNVDAKEYTSVEELLNDLPNTVTLGINDTDLFKNPNEGFFNVFSDALDAAEEKISTQSGISHKQVIGGKEYGWITYYDSTQIRKGVMSIYDANTGKDVLRKDIKFQYANESKFNTNDEAYIKSVMKGKTFDAWVATKDKSEATVKNAYTTFVKNVINNASVEITPIYLRTMGTGLIETRYYETVFGVVRNGVVYATVNEYVSAYKEIVIPDSVKDTEKAYLDYALPILKKDWPQLVIKKTEYLGNSMYKLFVAYQGEEASDDDYDVIIIKKNGVTRIMDNVTISYNTAFPEGKVLASTSETYKAMKTKMDAKGYNAFAAYDLKVTSGQITNKVTLTFTVNNSLNGKNVLVLMKNGNNYQEIQATVKNGKVSVGVYNLYPVMLGVAKNTPITSVKINQKNPTVVIKKTTKLSATINPSNTTQSKVLTWSSSNTKVATVDKNGVVKGIKAGTANITVKTSNGKTATVKVTVKKATPIKSVKLNKKTLKLELGKSATVKATINPSGTTDSKTLTWSSSNKKVATVDKNGKITAIGGGSAKITVKTSNGKKATVKVTVSKINAKKATITAIKNQTQTGKAIKPAVEVKLNGKTLKNGTDYTVTYKNNKNAGKATVTVKFKGNYTGSKSTTFLIIPKKVDIKNPSTAKKSITVKYSKVSGAKTYQIAYRVKGTKKWSYTTSKTASKKISKLTTGKQYEVMVRAGIKSGSKTLYGAWSNTKVIKVK